MAVRGQVLSCTVIGLTDKNAHAQDHSWKLRAVDCARICVNLIVLPVVVLGRL